MKSMTYEGRGETSAEKSRVSNGKPTATLPDQGDPSVPADAFRSVEVGAGGDQPSGLSVGIVLGRD